MNAMLKMVDACANILKIRVSPQPFYFVLMEKLNTINIYKPIIWK